MKVDVQKTEKKTLFGGSRYIVSARIELSPDEQQFAKRRNIDIVFFDLDHMKGLLGETSFFNWLNKMHGNRIKTYQKSFEVEFQTLAKASNYEDALMAAFKETKNQLVAQQESEKELGQKRTYEL